MALRRVAVVVGVVMLAGMPVVPARAEVSYFCLSVSRFPPIGQAYEVHGLLCHGSGTTDVTIAGGGTPVTHFCRAATLTGSTLKGTDCRQADS